jgi:nitrate/nitrite transport system substrate-binding protein
MNEQFKNNRRYFIKGGMAVLGGAALSGLMLAGLRSMAWAAGSDAPEKKEVKVGFIPLTD